MKKLLIALLIAGTAMSAMAQFIVMDVSIKGAKIDVPEEMTRMPDNQFSISKGGITGWIIAPMAIWDEGGGEGEVLFVERGKGEYGIADYCSVDSENFLNSIKETKTKIMVKGVTSLSIHLEINGMYLDATTLGKYVFTETDKGEKTTYSSKGAGILYDRETETDGYLSNVMIKINNKLTAGANEADDPIAYLEEALSKIVKDEVDLGMPK